MGKDHHTNQIARLLCQLQLSVRNLLQQTLGQDKPLLHGWLRQFLPSQPHILPDKYLYQTSLRQVTGRNSAGWIIQPRYQAQDSP